MHRALAVVVLAVLVLAAALGALALPAGSHGTGSTYIVTAYDAETENGTVSWFAVDNWTQPNPTIPVHAGDMVILILVNAGEMDHELEIQAPIGNTTGPVPPDGEASLIFRVPQDAPAEIGYLDPGHAGSGMQGVLQVNGSQPQPASAVPAPGPLVVLGAALGLAVAVAGAGSSRRS